MWYFRVAAWVAELIPVYGCRPKELTVSSKVYTEVMHHMTGGRVIKGTLMVNGCTIRPGRHLFLIKS